MKQPHACPLPLCAPRAVDGRRALARLALRPISLAACLLGAIAPGAFALPQGAVPTSGQTALRQTAPGQLDILQSTPRASIDWASFSIAVGERVNVVQPDRSSVLLNRVVGDNPSLIYGSLTSNGSVWLINPRGIVFGATSRVDVGGLVASTLSIGNDALTSGRLQLGAGAGGAGELRSEGSITATDGTVALVAPQLVHSGQIAARRVGLAAASEVLVDVEGDGLVFFNARNDRLDTRLALLGSVRADGGTADIRAVARAGFADTVLNLDGVVQARSIGTRMGRIVIDGGSSGITRVAGTLDASAPADGDRGGSVLVQGEKILLDRTAVLDASGTAGGGGVRVGGDFQGHNPDVRNAAMVSVMPGARLSASATDTGDGGTVIVWSDQATRFWGSVQARGGRVGGNGGFVEVSGKAFLDFRGQADLSAPYGLPGTLLLDPTNLTIAQDNPDFAGDGGHDDLPGATLEFNEGGVESVITAGRVVDLLVGNPVVLKASGHIAVNADINSASAQPLTLKAAKSITVDAVISVGGDLTLSANDRDAAAFDRDAGAKVTVRHDISTAGLLTIGNDATGAIGDGVHAIGANLTADTLSVTGGVDLTAASRWTLGSAANLSSRLTNSSTFALTKAGAGVLTLGGAASYGGSLTIDGGGVTLSGALGASTLTLNSGGTLTAGNAHLAASADIVVNGGGTLTINGANAVHDVSMAGNLNGTAALSAHAFTLQGSASVVGLLGTGDIAVTGADVTLNAAAEAANVSVANGAKLTLGAAASLPAAAVTVVSGGTLALGASQTIDTLSIAGTLVAGHTLTASTYNLRPGAVVNANLGTGTLDATGAGPRTLNGSTAAGFVNVRSGATLVLGASADLAANAAVLVERNAGLTLGRSQTVFSLNLAGTLGGGAGKLLTTAVVSNLTDGAVLDTGLGGAVVSAGSVTMNQPGTVSNWAISGGQLTVSAGNLLDNALMATVASGATLTLGGGTNTINTLTLMGTVSGAGTLAAGTLNSSGDSALITGNVSATNGTVLNGTLTVGNGGGLGSLGGTLNVPTESTLDFNRSGSATVGTLLENGTLRHSGSGTLTLTGSANFLKSLDVSGTGELVLANGSGSRIGDGTDVTVAANARLTTGNLPETVKSLTLAGTLGGSATLTAGTYALQGNAIVNAPLGAGTVTVSGNNVRLNAAAAATTVEVNGGATLLLGAAANLSDSATVTVANNGTLMLGADDTIRTLNLAGMLGGAFHLTTTGDSALQSGTVAEASTLVGAAGKQLTVTGNATLNGRAEYDQVRINNFGVLQLGTAADRLLDSTSLTIQPQGALHLANNETIGSLSGQGQVFGHGFTLSTGSVALDGNTVDGALTTHTLTSNGGSSILGTVQITGDALVNSGTLTVGNGGTAGSMTVGGTTTINAGATLSFSRSDFVAVNNVLAGTGTLQQAGAGELNLGSTASAQTVNVTAGTFSLADGNANRLADTAAVVVSGGTFRLGNAGETVGTLTLAGTLAGTGTLTAATTTLQAGSNVIAPLGSGNLVVTGASTLRSVAASGHVEVRDGGALTLTNTASLHALADVVIAGGGTLTLGASDNVRSLTAAGHLAGTGFTLATSNGSTLLGGAVIDANLGAGTLTVEGNSQLNGSSGAGTLIIDGGTLTLGGGARLGNPLATVTVMATAGSGLVLGGNETVASFTSAGSLSGAAGARLTATTQRLQTGATVNAELGGGTLEVDGTATLNRTATLATVHVNDGGTLTTGAANLLDDGAAVTVAAAGTLALGGDDTVRALTSSGLVTGTGHTLRAGTITLQGANSRVLANLGAGTLAVAGTATLDGTAGSSLLTIANGASLTLGSGSRLGGAPVVQNAGLITLAGDETFGSLAGAGAVALGTATLGTGSAGDSIFAGTLSGAGNLVKQGASTFTLGGPQGYTGITTVERGTLQLGGAEVLHDDSRIVVANLGTLKLAGTENVAALTLAGTLDGAGTLVAGNVTMNSGHTTASAALIAGQLVTSGNSTLGGTADADVRVTDGVLTLGSANRLAKPTAAVVVEAGLLTLGGDEQIGSLTLAGTLDGSGHRLTASSHTLQDGAVVKADLGGGAVTVGGQVALDGRAAVASVALAENASLTLGATPDRIVDTAAVTVGRNAHLVLGGDESVATLTVAGTLSGAGALTAATTTLQAGSTASANLRGATLIVTGDATLGGTAGATDVRVTDGTLQLGSANRLAAGAIVTVAGPATLAMSGSNTVQQLNLSGTLTGSGTLTATGAPGYVVTGGTASAALGSGTLNASGASRLAASAAVDSVAVANGALTLTAAGSFSAAPAVTLAGTGTLVLGSDQTFGTLTGSGTLSMGGHTLTTGNASSSTFDGLLQGAGNLVKQGTGTFTLGGSHRYGGSTQVLQGTLALQSGNVLPDSTDVTVAAHATLALGGSDTVHSLVVAGTVAGSGLLSADSYALNAGTVTDSAALGAGTLGSTGASTLAGTAAATTVNIGDGTLTLAAAERLAAGATVHVSGTGGLQLGGAQTVLALDLSGTLAGSGHTLTATGGSTLQAGARVDANLGAGRLDVAGDATLAGTAATETVNIVGSKLTLASGGRLAGGAKVTIGTGAELSLGGDEVIATLDLTGKLSGITHRLNAGQYTLRAGARAEARLGHGQLDVEGDATLANTADAQVVRVNAGILSLATGDLLADDADVTVKTGATLRLTDSDTIGSLTLSGTVDGHGTLNAGSYRLSDGNYDLDLGTGSLTSSGRSRLNGSSAAAVVDVLDGTLTLGSGGRFTAAPAVSVGPDALLVLGGDETFGSLAGAGNVGLGQHTLTAGDRGDSSFGGSLWGSGGLTKVGDTTFTLAGDSVYTGITRVQGGVLNVGGTSASTQLQVKAGTLALGAAERLANNAVVDVARDASFTLAGAQAIGALTLVGTLGGSGTLTAANYAVNGGTVNTNLGRGALVSTGQSSVNGNAAVATIAVNGGVLTLAADEGLGALPALTIAADATLRLAANQTAGTLAGAGTVDLGSHTLRTGAAGDSRYAGVIVGTGDLVKQGPGTFTLGGANLFTGATRVEAGTLALAGADRLADSSAVQVLDGATLALAGDDTVGSLSLAGTLSGSGTLTASTYVLASGLVNASLGAGALTSSGESKLSATSAAKSVAVQGGHLQLMSSDRLIALPAVSVAAGATLELGGDEAFGLLAGAGGVALHAFTLSTGLLDNSNFAGTLSGSGGLVKVGGSVFTLSGDSTYTGTTRVAGGNLTVAGTLASAALQVDAGTLALAGADRLADTATVTVARDAALTLAGDDTVASLTLAGTLGGAGTLSAGTYALNGGSVSADLGAGTLTATGVSTLAGHAAASHVSVDGGTLTLAGPNRLADTAIVTVATDAALALTGDDLVASLALSGKLGGSGTLTAQSVVLDSGTVVANLGSGTLVSRGNSALVGTAAADVVTVETGSLALASAQRLLAAPAVAVNAAAALTLNGDQTIGSLAGSGDVALARYTLATGGGGSSLFAGVLSGNGGLIKQGSSSTFTLTGRNTYGGVTEVAAGTLRVGDGATAGSLASSDYRLTGALVFARSDDVTLAQPVAGSGSVEQAGSGRLLFSGQHKTYTGPTTVTRGELATAGADELPGASAVTVSDNGRLTLGGNQTLRSLDAAGAVSLGGDLSTSADLLLRGAVTTTGAVMLSGQRIDAVNDGNRFGGAVSLDARERVTLSGGREGGVARDLLLGSVTVAAGGRVDAAVLALGGVIAVNGGALELVSAAPRTALAPDADLANKQATGLPVAWAADAVTQGEASRISVASGASLGVTASQGGSVQLLRPDNSFAGGVSVVAGTAGTPWSPEASAIDFGRAAPITYAVQSRVRLNGSTIRLVGDGIVADVVSIRADRLASVGTAEIVARLPFDAAAGTASSLPALTLELTPAAYDLGFAFGAPGADAGLRVNVGSRAYGGRTLPLDAGYVTVLPRDGARGATVVLLTGPVVNPAGGYRFFFDGAGSQTQIPVFYNGVLPTTPQVENSISATVAVSEGARKQRFDEAVRTENVAVRLRAGVIAEVGPAPSATQGSEGLRVPPSCPPDTGSLRCMTGTP